MSKNPFLNALGASLYISLVSLFMYYGSRHMEQEDSVIIPIAMISLFTLSAAVMGYFFISQPLQLYLDGNKKEATGLFVKTILAFAGITLVLFLGLFLRSLIN